MYTLGLSAAIFGGGDSIITIMMNAGLGLAGPHRYHLLYRYYNLYGRLLCRRI